MSITSRILTRQIRRHPRRGLNFSFSRGKCVSLPASGENAGEPQFQYPFGAMENGDLWDAEGKVLWKLRGAKKVDLGDGVSRVDWRNGEKTIFGLKLEGKEVVHTKKDRELEWGVVMEKYADFLEADSNQTGEPVLQSEFIGTSATGEKIGSFQLKRYPLGQHGSQFSSIDFPSCGSVKIFSDGEISEEHLKRIGGILLTNPVQSFPLVAHGIFVVDQLGETRTPHSSYVTIGCTNSRQEIFVMRSLLVFDLERLHDFNMAAQYLNHEMGHVLNRHKLWKISKKIHGKDGKRLFGSGKLIMPEKIPFEEYLQQEKIKEITASFEKILAKEDESTRQSLINEILEALWQFESKKADLQHSDFVSPYASKDDEEDFAETHAFTLYFRRGYNACHPGAEFLDQSESEIASYLQSLKLSPKIQEKTQAIVKIYQLNKDLTFEHSAVVLPGTGGIIQAALFFAKRMFSASLTAIKRQ